MTNLGSILKIRDVTLPTKVHLLKAMVFPVIMYGCESWTIKKAENQRIDVFELWYWRRLLRVHWTARRSNQSIIKEISPEYTEWWWGWSSNTLTTWGEELTLPRIRKVSDAGKDWRQEEKGKTEDELAGWHHPLTGQVWASSGSGDGQWSLACCIGSQRVRDDWVIELTWTDDKFSFSFSTALKWFYDWFEYQLCSFMVNLLILILNEKIGHEDWCPEGILKNGACVKLLPEKQEGSLRVGWEGVTYHRQWGEKPG